MSAGNLCFLVLTALLAVHVIFAEDAQDHHEGGRDRWSITFHRNGNASERRRPPFSFLPLISGCNYNTEAGFSCGDCNTVKLCSANNVSVSFRCNRFQPYCVGGACQSSPSASCNSTSSS